MICYKKSVRFPQRPFPAENGRSLRFPLLSAISFASLSLSPCEQSIHHTCFLFSDYSFDCFEVWSWDIRNSNTTFKRVEPETFDCVGRYPSPN